jgi:ABC-type glycerol-3-phosphate transport system substrate-binding protein
VFAQASANNQMYAYPLQISPLVLRFNADIFNQAGVPLPQSTWTVSDLQDALGQLRFVLTDDQFPLELNASGQTALLMLIAAYGGIPFDTRTSPPTISFTDPATEAALLQVLDLLANGELTYSGGGFGPGGGQTDDTVPLYSNVINAFSFGGPGGGPNAQNQNTDGIVPFPRGSQFNAVAFNLGTAYISASAENPEACYRFISAVSQSTELFDSMPARYSQIDNPILAQVQGDDTVAFYRDLANLIDQPTTLVFPNNINAGNFGMTNWLFEVFDRYVAGEVVDLNADLTDAEQSTRAYLDCVAALPPFNPGDTNPQDFFAQIQACQSSATA